MGFEQFGAISGSGGPESVLLYSMGPDRLRHSHRTNTCGEKSAAPSWRKDFTLCAVSHWWLVSSAGLWVGVLAHQNQNLHYHLRSIQ